MGRNRWHGKPDANLDLIRSALLSAGCVVIDTGALGGGAPDLLVYRILGGSTVMRFMEVKSGKGRLRPSQEAFRDKYPHLYCVVRSPSEALKEMGMEIGLVQSTSRKIAS